MARPDGRVLIHGSAEGLAIDADAIGSALAIDVRARGGDAILAELEGAA